MIVSTASPADALGPPGDGRGALCGNGASIGVGTCGESGGARGAYGACVFTDSETRQPGHDNWEDEDGEDEHEPVADPDQGPLPWELKAEGTPAITLVRLELIQDQHHGQEDPEDPREDGNEDQAGRGGLRGHIRGGRWHRRRQKRRLGWRRRRVWRKQGTCKIRRGIRRSVRKV